MKNNFFKFGLFDINKTTLNYKERLDIYKQIGFLRLGIYVDDKFMKDGESYADIVKYAREIGIKVEQGHIDYANANMICDEEDDSYFDYIESKILECEKLEIPFMIIHASKTDNPPQISQKQLMKVKKLAEKYNGNGVILCFENVRRNYNLNKILALNLPNVKMCYDVGHAFCHESCKLTTHDEIFNKKDIIACTHIHNNNLEKDLHERLSQGKIPFKNFLSTLLEVSKSNLLEVFPEKGLILNKEEFVNFVEGCYKDCQEVI